MISFTLRLLLGPLPTKYPLL